MNTQQIKDTIRKFKAADLTQVKDAELRAKGEKLQAKQGGFTLLELMVVVAILAVIAGAVISNLNGQEEGAAQATAVHTMAALEGGMNVYNVTEKRLLPGGLDSLLCSSAVSASGAELTVNYLALGGASTAELSAGGNNSNVPRVNGGLTADLADKIHPVNVTSAAISALADNGLTSVRYVLDTVCNDTENQTIASGAQDTALVEVSKPSLIFNDIVADGADWEFGAGAAADLTDLSGMGAATTMPVAIFLEPAELGAEEDDVIAVFGVGPSAELGDIIARAPQDGNVGADKYANFSVAVKIAECGSGEAEDLEDASGCPAGSWDEIGEEMEVIAILDAGGDAYDDEIAEAKGNEEE